MIIMIVYVCHPVYHHNDFTATHALGHMIYGYTLLVLMKEVTISDPPHTE